MSNISQASKNIKKKLSFDDYSTPASQQDDTQVSQCNSMPANQQDVSTLLPHTIAPAVQQDIITVLSPTSTLNIPASKQVVHACTQVRQQDGELVQHKAATPKTKATFYLSEEDSQALTDMFIKRLQAKNKTDKSALIAEAIQLLYKQEIKQ